MYFQYGPDPTFDDDDQLWVKVRGNLEWQLRAMDPADYMHRRAHEFWGPEVCVCLECLRISRDMSYIKARELWKIYFDKVEEVRNDQYQRAQVHRARDKGILARMDRAGRSFLDRLH